MGVFNTMNRKRTLQQGALAVAFASYMGYVVYDRFAQHEETAIANAKRRGRLRGEAKVRLREIEESAAKVDGGLGGIGGEESSRR